MFKNLSFKKKLGLGSVLMVVPFLGTFDAWGGAN